MLLFLYYIKYYETFAKHPLLLLELKLKDLEFWNNGIVEWWVNF